MKFIEPLAADAGTGRRRKRYYQFTAIDDCTRIRVLRIYERNTQKSAIQFMDYVLAKLPFAVEVVQTDNDLEAGYAVSRRFEDVGLTDRARSRE